MIFQIAKKDGIKCCRQGCTATIQRNEEMVLSFIRKGDEGKSVTVLTYHLGCYIPWYTNMFNEKWANWHNNSGVNKNPRPRRGTPPKILEPSKADLLNRLRSNLSYHKHLGHLTKVSQIENKISNLLDK